MSSLKGLLARVHSIAGSRTSESRMEEEFRFHVEMETRRLVEQHGLPHDEAHRRALVSFGGLDGHREAMRDGRGARWIDDLVADVRYALRSMRRAPGFASAVALTLGVGIGVNGIVFGYVDSLLFRRVPARDADALVSMFTVDAKTKQPNQVAYEDYLDFRKSGVFDGLAGMAGIPLNVAVPGSTNVSDLVWGEIVTDDFFSVLGMTPALGRLFSPSDAAQGQDALAVLSHDGWIRRFGGDSSIIGRRIRINGTVFTVVGVAARGFRGMRTFGFWPEIWVPMGMHDVAWPGSAHLLEGRGFGWMMTVGRMRRGMDRTRTEVAAQRFATQLGQAYPVSNATTDVMIIPAAVGFDHPAFVKPKIIVLASALGVFASLVTLIIICANLVNLQLARAGARASELAIRLSLGCSRARLTRQMLVESSVLAIPGAIIAIGLLRSSTVIESFMLPHLQFRVGMSRAGVDARVALFTTATALFAILLFGLVPALRASQNPSLSILIGAKRTSAGRPHRLRGVLVVSQLSLSVVLLVGAMLFVRSMMLARAVDLGFDSQHRALMSVNVGLQGYDTTRAKRFYDDVLSRVRALPAVASAAWMYPVPFDTYGRSVSLYVEGAPTRSKDGTIQVSVSVTSEDFVNALGLRLEGGRDFTTGDTTGAPLVMVVSHQLAARFWPGTNPIGQRARRGGATGPEITVVGVVGDAKFESLGPTSVARVYMPLRQRYRDWQTLVVHTRDDPAAVVAQLKSSVAALDPVLPVFGATTMEQSVESGLSTSRTAAAIAGFFGALAVLISSVGLYAVVASRVSERTRELGVRMALGSTPSDVMWLVMRGGARLGLVGLAIGLGGSVVVARLMSALLYGMSPADPFTFVLVPLTLAVVVLVATYIPARRAVRLDPMVALRNE